MTVKQFPSLEAQHAADLEADAALEAAELEADRNLQFATRRERIATAALAAFLSADSATVTQIPIFARWAVKAADALIAELDRDPVQGDGR